MPGLVVLVGVFVHQGQVVADGTSDILARGRLDTAHLLAEVLDEKLDEQFDQLHFAASRVTLGPEGASQRRQALLDVLDSPDNLFLRAAFIGMEGQLLAVEPDHWSEPVLDLTHHTYLAGAGSAGWRYVSAVHADSETGLPVAVIAVPVPAHAGAPGGVLAATLNLTHPVLQSLVVSARQMGEKGYAELVDQNLQLVFSSDRPNARGPAEHPTFYRPLLAERRSAVGLTDPIGDEDPVNRGQRHVMAFVPLKAVPWGLGLGGSESVFTAASDTWRVETLPLAALALGIGVFLILVTRLGVVAPLRALTRASESIAAGNLATRVPELGHGEVRVLAEHLDTMRVRLQQAQEALAEEKSRYKGIFESMMDAVVCTDDQSRITAFNPAAEALTGAQAAEVLGLTLREALRTGQDQGPRGAAGPRLQAGPPVSRWQLTRRTGEELAVASSRAPISGQDGLVKGAVYVMHDVTAEDEVDRLKDQFLSTISHELRTPLGCIKGYATTLLLPDADWDAATRERCLRIIVESSDDLEDLMDTLLDMSKISAGVLTVNPRSTDLTAVVATAVERVRGRLHGQNLRLQLAADLPNVQADARRIEQVLTNLLDNAIKYSTDGDITVAVAVLGDRVRVSVVDQGQGIAPEDVAGVFTRFYRGRAARTQPISGCGLGLAICKGIVEAHGGRIWLDSPAPDRAPASGTSVSFTLRLDSSADALQSWQAPGIDADRESVEGRLEHTLGSRGGGGS